MELSGTGMEKVIQNLPMILLGTGVEVVKTPSTEYFCKGISAPRVRVAVLCGSHGTVGYRFKRLIVLREVSGTSNTRVNIPGMQDPHRAQHSWRSRQL